MSNQSQLVVTVTADFKKAVFTWSEDMSEFEYTAFGFEGDEIDSLIAAKAHQGVDVDGYAVDLQ
jgi:hypothetical protein